HHDGLRAAGLCLCERNRASVKVHLIPSEIQDFGQAAASEQQEFDRRGSDPRKERAAGLGLRQMLGWRLLRVDVPWQALCFRLPQRRPKAGEFVSRQEALALVLLVALNLRARITTIGPHGPGFGKSEGL